MTGQECPEPETVTLLCGCTCTRNCDCGDCGEDTLVIQLCAPHEFDHGDPEWWETHEEPRNAAGCSCVICEIRDGENDDCPEDDIGDIAAIWEWIESRAT